MLEMYAHPYIEDPRSTQAHAAFRLLSQTKSTDIQKPKQKINDVGSRPSLTKSTDIQKPKQEINEVGTRPYWYPTILQCLSA